MTENRDDDKYVRASLKIALRLKKEPNLELDALIDEEALRNSLDRHKLARYFAQNQQVWMGSNRYQEK
ncbi:MAG: hypothetical protein N3B13_02005 [Deltaproteobacteria bacterium]|nr:hypothetical protein [Deltaproteobacteria bacterium]